MIPHFKPDHTCSYKSIQTGFLRGPGQDEVEEHIFLFLLLVTMNLYSEVVSGRQCVLTGGFSHLLHVRKEHTIQHNTTLGNILHSAAGARGFDKCHLLLRRMTTTSLFIFVSISMCFFKKICKS